MKGPAIFLAQFAGTAPPFDKLETMAQWAAGLGYVGVQVPTDPKLFDLELAAKSQTYCDDIAASSPTRKVISELSKQLKAARPVHRRTHRVCDVGPPSARQAARGRMGHTKLKPTRKARRGSSSNPCASAAPPYWTRCIRGHAASGLVEAASRTWASWRTISTHSRRRRRVASRFPGEDLHTARRSAFLEP